MWYFLPLLLLGAGRERTVPAWFERGGVAERRRGRRVRRERNREASNRVPGSHRFPL